MQTQLGYLPHMQQVPGLSLSFAGFFGGWEVVLILAFALVLFLAKGLPELFRGAGRGFDEFRKAIGNLRGDAFKAGESLGGIYGKPAAQALTYDNQVAEFYEASDAAPQPNNATPTLLRRLWNALRRLLRRL